MSTGSGNTTVAGNFIGMTALGASVGTSGHDRRADGRRLARQPDRPADPRGPQRHRRRLRGRRPLSAPAPTATSCATTSSALSPNGTSVYDDRRQRHRPQLRSEEQHHRRLRAARAATSSRAPPTAASSSPTAGTRPWRRAQDTSLPWQINDNQVLGNYIGFNPAGALQQHLCRRDAASRAARPTTTARASTSSTARTAPSSTATTITGLRSGVAVTSPVSQGNIVRNNVIGHRAARQPPPRSTATASGSRGRRRTTRCRTTRSPTPAGPASASTSRRSTTT